VSATQAGLSEPSTSTATRTTTCTPPLASSAETTSPVARTRAPDGTGLGNRTFSSPTFRPAENVSTVSSSGSRRFTSDRVR